MKSHLKLLEMSVALMTVMAMVAPTSAHCPKGGECFTKQDALDCQKAAAELKKCDAVEAENEKLAGRLNESRRDSRKKAKKIEVLQVRVDELKNRPTDWDLAKSTGAGFAAGVIVTVVGAVIYSSSTD